MSTAGDRMRLMRARRKEREAGIEQFTTKHKVDRLALALAEDGFLEDWDDTDHNAIGRALQAMVETYVVIMIGPDDDGR